MIPAGVQIFVALEPVDMRFGFERLSGMVRERMGYEPRSGALFVFVGRRRQLVKILFAMIGARSAAMAHNRLADRELDAANPRTASRALPSGVLSVTYVRAFLAA